MKQHSADFKNVIKKLGRKIDSVITYGNTTLHDELYSVTPMYEGNLLKSIMKQLDVESLVDIPKDTVINYQLKVLVGNSYETMNFGNYVVVQSEKQEDKGTYKITCYDKMIYSMKQNASLGISYPITVKNYLKAVASRIGLQVEETTFKNQDILINQELYAGLDYTYRDILDEIAQATGSIIVINSNDKIEVKYPNVTNDTIDEEFLKDINVTFKEKYGPVNSIVLSRSGESDNVYLQDEESIIQNGLCEVKIVDNQIMNWNDRANYLQGILEALDGLYFYMNDFSSTGIIYYDIYDIYNVQIGQNTYQCLMLNDEVNISLGIEEIIHTDMPEQSETDYTKSDKSERGIYLIVDKQNQRIEAVVEEVDTYSSRITQVEQEVDGIRQLVENTVDYKRTVEGKPQIHLTEAMQEDALKIEVRGDVTYLSELYPGEGLYPGNDLYPNMSGSELR